MGTFSGCQGDLVAPQEWREPQWLDCNASASVVQLELKRPSAGSSIVSYLLVSKTKSMKQCNCSYFGIHFEDYIF